MAKNYRLTIDVEERNQAGRTAEEDGNWKAAAKLYEQNIRLDYADELAFERLMIIYRKEKDYKSELRVINRGIKVFKESMEDHLKSSLGRHVDGFKLERISKAIMKTANLAKNTPHFPDPIDKWMKRKKIVEGKLQK